MKIALIGAGFFAQFHAEAWNRLKPAHMAAIVDRDVARAKEFAARWEIPAVYGSAEEMLCSERPDVVDIITRPESHVELTALSAAAGAHVICQKPMAPGRAECEAMVASCRQHGVRLIVHENWRWQPWYREIKTLLDEGVVGEPFHIGFRMRTGDGRGPEPYKVQPYFREMPRLLVYETSVHFIDTFRFLMGEIGSINCMTAKINPLIRGEDYALIQLRFFSGAHGVVDANRISGPAIPEIAFGELRIEGTNATIRISPDGRIWLGFGGEERSHTYDIPSTGYKGDSVYAIQQHILECLRTGQPAESEGHAYLATVEAVDASYRSAERGTTERLL